MVKVQWEDNPNRHERRRRLRQLRSLPNKKTKGAFGSQSKCPRFFRNKKFTYKNK